MKYIKKKFLQLLKFIKRNYLNDYFVENYFKTDFSKRVLVSYLTEPFLIGYEHRVEHSNYTECLKIAEIFNKRGYIVDIVEYNLKKSLRSAKRHKYDIIFGSEPNFLNAINHIEHKKSIYYATGAYYKFQNNAEETRLNELRRRRGVSLKPIRHVVPHASAELADAVICIGNDWTISTYKGHCKQIQKIDVSAHSFCPFSEIQEIKDFDTARKNFLWLGSYGVVHKGLDLLLEVFVKHPELNLYVCGGLENEESFMKIYQNELFDSPNIHYEGWVMPNSQKYKDLVVKCAYYVFPSCSEGMSGSTATTMLSGLIPIISMETGIDCGKDGVILDDCSINTIENTVLKMSNIPAKGCQTAARNIAATAAKQFSITRFISDFELALDRIAND
jgi:hypothetical protein